MPYWMLTTGQMSLAGALATFGLVIYLSPMPKTRLAIGLILAAWLASVTVLFHFFVPSLPGWPAMLTGVFIWVNAFSVFKHRLAVSASISRSLDVDQYGRRYDD